MMCIISKENCILCAGKRNTRRNIRSVTHRIAFLMQACTQRTHSDVLSQLATTPEWSFKIGDRQNAKNQWNRDRRAIYNATHCIGAGRGVIRRWGVSDGTDWARPLWRSQSSRTELFLLMNVYWLSSTVAPTAYLWHRAFSRDPCYHIRQNTSPPSP